MTSRGCNSDPITIDDFAASLVDQVDDLDIDTRMTYHLGEVSANDGTMRISIQIDHSSRTVFLLEDTHGRTWMILRCLRSSQSDIRSLDECACLGTAFSESIRFLTENENLKFSHPCCLQ